MIDDGRYVKGRGGGWKRTLNKWSGHAGILVLFTVMSKTFLLEHPSYT